MAIRRFYLAHLPSRRWPRASAIAIAILVIVVNSAFMTGVQVLAAAVALWRV